jgi:hypothetical protein
VEEAVVPEISVVLAGKRPWEPTSHEIEAPITYPLQTWRGDVVGFLRDLINHIHQDLFPLDSLPAAWLRWVQIAKVDGCFPLFHADGSMVTHPLSLLDAGVMQCGQVARLLYDGFASCGFRTRLVHCQSHVTCEVFFDGDWRLAEASALDGGVIPRWKGEWVGVKDAHLLSKDAGFAPYLEQTLRRCPNYPWMNDEAFDAVKVWRRVFSTVRGFGNKPTNESTDNHHYGWARYSWEIA